MVQVSRELISAFIDAAVQDQTRARALLKAHPELLHARTLHGQTVLHFLAVESYPEAVRFLAAAGAEVDATNDFGDTPLVDAATLGDDEVAEVLLGFGADPNARSATRENVLHAAVRTGSVRLVQLLLGAGADPAYQTELGETVLNALPQKAACRDPILQLLKAHGLASKPA